MCIHTTYIMYISTNYMNIQHICIYNNYMSVSKISNVCVCVYLCRYIDIYGQTTKIPKPEWFAQLEVATICLDICGRWCCFILAVFSDTLHFEGLAAKCVCTYIYIYIIVDIYIDVYNIHMRSISTYLKHLHALRLSQLSVSSSITLPQLLFQGWFFFTAAKLTVVHLPAGWP